MVKSSGPPPSCCGRLSPLLVARADEAFDRRCSLLHCVGPLMAHSGALRRTSVDFGAKRTLTEPRLRLFHPQFSIAFGSRSTALARALAIELGEPGFSLPASDDCGARRGIHPARVASRGHQHPTAVTPNGYCVQAPWRLTAPFRGRLHSYLGQDRRILLLAARGSLAFVGAKGPPSRIEALTAPAALDQKAFLTDRQAVPSRI